MNCEHSEKNFTALPHSSRPLTHLLFHVMENFLKSSVVEHAAASEYNKFQNFHSKKLQNNWLTRWFMSSNNKRLRTSSSSISIVSKFQTHPEKIRRKLMIRLCIVEENCDLGYAKEQKTRDKYEEESLNLKFPSFTSITHKVKDERGWVSLVRWR